MSEGLRDETCIKARCGLNYATNWIPSPSSPTSWQRPATAIQDVPPPHPTVVDLVLRYANPYQSPSARSPIK